MRRQCHSFFHDLNAQTNVSQHLHFSTRHNEKAQANIEAQTKIEAQGKIEAQARCIPGPQHF
jgi:hypothetical protein